MVEKTTRRSSSIAHHYVLKNSYGCVQRMVGHAGDVNGAWGPGTRSSRSRLFSAGTRRALRSCIGSTQTGFRAALRSPVLPGDDLLARSTYGSCAHHNESRRYLRRKITTEQRWCTTFVNVSRPHSVSRQPPETLQIRVPRVLAPHIHHGATKCCSLLISMATSSRPQVW